MYCEGTRKVFHSGEAPGLCFEMQFYSSALMSHSTLIDTGTVHKASGKKKKNSARTHTHTCTHLCFSHQLSFKRGISCREHMKPSLRHHRWSTANEDGAQTPAGRTTGRSAQLLLLLIRFKSTISFNIL